MNRTAELVRRLAEGDEIARAELIASLLPDAERYAHYAARRYRVDSEELVSEAQLRLIETIDRYDPAHESGYSVRAWVFVGVTLSLKRWALRERTRQDRHVSLDGPIDGMWLSDHEFTPDEWLSDHEFIPDELRVEPDLDELRMTLDAAQVAGVLDDRDRAMLDALRAGHTLREIGEAMELSYERVRQRTNRAAGRVKGWGGC